MKYCMSGIIVCTLLIALAAIGMLALDAWKGYKEDKEKKRRKLNIQRADSSLESICNLIVKSQEDRYEVVPIRVLLSMGYDPEVNPQRWN